ncbi:ATP-dependent RNA helicase [Sesbania bispinosa]|nr:ATP-dependent RNA helicase [Sesbania bispinosa]
MKRDKLKSEFFLEHSDFSSLSFRVCNWEHEGRGNPLGYSSGGAATAGGDRRERDAAAGRGRDRGALRAVLQQGEGEPRAEEERDEAAVVRRLPHVLDFGWLMTVAVLGKTCAASNTVTGGAWRWP